MAELRFVGRGFEGSWQDYVAARQAEELHGGEFIATPIDRVTAAELVIAHNPVPDTLPEAER